MVKAGPNDGRKNPMAKLNPMLVQAIRDRYEAGDSQGKLARLYGVSINTIGRIVRGESWNSVPNGQEAELPPLLPEQANRVNAAGMALAVKLAGTPPAQPTTTPKGETDGPREAIDSITGQPVKLPY